LIAISALLGRVQLSVQRLRCGVLAPADQQRSRKKAQKSEARFPQHAVFLEIKRNVTERPSSADLGSSSAKPE
jgi:hypothetical protein